MFCKKCGSPISENEQFCPKCNEPTKQEAVQSNYSDKMTNKTFRAIIQSKASIISSLCIVIFSLKMITSGFDKYGINFRGILLTSLVCFAIWLYCTILTMKGLGTALKAKKHNPDHFCPKCHQVTHHNKYGVCSNCQLDSISDSQFSLVSDAISAILFFAGMFSGSSDVFLIVMIIICILNVLCILSMLYMYPARLARRTEHTAASAIFWLNIFFGWTFVMWIVLMIWSSSGKEGKNAIPQQMNAPQKSAQESFEELKHLKDMGVITEEEYEMKRQELLSRI